MLVKRAVRHRTRGDNAERQRLYSLLKQNRWTEDPFLHRQMRKQWQGGRSHVTNQIVADSGSYTTKVWHGRAWIHLQSMDRGQRIAIPLKGTHLPSGTLRILLQANGQVEIHYAVDEEAVCSTRPCGDATVGVDKGYTEAYTDSDGERHGEDLGDLLAQESDARKVKGQRRNKLRDLEEKHRDKGHTRKADNIRQNNLGNRKWDRRQVRHRKQVRDHLCQAAHAVVDKAGTLACENLSLPMKSAKYRHRDTNRRLNGWVKGVMADTLTSISRRRGSALALVNPAYTSQSTPGRVCCRARVDGIGFTAPTGLCWTRMPMPPATFWRGCTTRRLRCTGPTGTCAPCSRNEPGQRWGLLHPDSSCGGLQRRPQSTESEVPSPVPIGTD